MEFFRHLLPNFKAGAQSSRSPDSMDVEEAPVDNRPKKWAKPQGKGQGHQSTRGGGHRRGMELSDEGLQELVRMVAVLTIRHEDQHALHALDKGFHLHQQTGIPPCMLGTLFQLSEQWKKKRSEAPQQLMSSLRIILFRSYMEEFIARLQKADAQEMQVHMREQGWIRDLEGEMHWVYMHWNPQDRKEEPDLHVPPVQHQQVVRTVQIVLKHTTDMSLHKFHATRPLTEQIKGPSVCFKIEVGLRGESSQELHRALCMLAQCSALHLMGANLQRERIHRSPLAQSVASKIYK